MKQSKDELIHQYQTAYEIFMDYFNNMHYEDRKEIDKKLREIGL